MLAKRWMAFISAGMALAATTGPPQFRGAAGGSAWGSGRTATVARNPASGTRPERPARSVERPPAGTLPDSVLVRVDGRGISRSFAVRRWRELHRAAADDSITPAALQEFLDLLTDEAVLAEAAGREAAPWSPADSSAHQALRDRLVLTAALDSVLAATRA